MKTQKTIQKLAKLGEILSIIAFVCSIIGLCGCVIAVVILPILKNANIIIDGKNLVEILQTTSGENINSLIALVSEGIVISIGQIIVSKFAINYFKCEIKDTTPFTFSGAKKLFNLGIIDICVSLGTIILSAIIHLILKTCLNNVGDMKYENLSSGIMLGLAFIIVSLLCKLGAEKQENEQKQNDVETVKNIEEIENNNLK